MKKLIFIGVVGLFILGSCNSKNTGHEGHDHETVTHNHDEHEGHDHEVEGHDPRSRKEPTIHTKVNASGGHDHGKVATSEPAGEHSDEIILPKAKADAAGVKVNAITPAPFQQVIKTSGQVLAAQGDESVGRSHGGRSRFFPRQGDGRNERRSRHSVGDYFFAQHRRR